jgi:C4-dicarboxylate-specific signal transduction histidine kinase
MNKSVLLSIIISICILITSFALSIHFYNHSIKTAEKMILFALRLAASETAKKVSYILKDKIVSLEVESIQLNQITSMKAKHDSLSNYYDILSKLKEDLKSLWILDKNGTLLFLTPKKRLEEQPSPIGKNFSFRNYFQAVKKSNSPEISSVTSDEYTIGQDTIFIAVPIQDEKGKFNGILGADIDLLHLIQDIGISIDDPSNILSPSNETIDLYCLSTNSGIVLAGPNAEDLSKEQDVVSKKNLLQFMESLPKNTNNTISAITEGKKGKTLIAASLITLNKNRTPYAIMVTIPYTSVSKHIFYSVIKIGILIMATLAAVIFVSYTLISNNSIIRRQQNKIKKMKILLDYQSKNKEVKNIEETEYFQTLMKEVELIKSDNRNHNLNKKE